MFTSYSVKDLGKLFDIIRCSLCFKTKKEIEKVSKQIELFIFKFKVLDRPNCPSPTRHCPMVSHINLVEKKKPILKVYQDFKWRGEQIE